MASGLLGIGTSGLLAFQRSIDTIGHNISNVNTDGYSRQTVQLTNNKPQANGFGFAGTGVRTSSITRSYDAFVESSVRRNTSASAESDAFHNLAVQLDNILADGNAGLSSGISQFYSAMQDVANDPANTAAREVLYKNADQLSKRFNDLANYIEDTRGQLNNTVTNNVSEINRITKNIADLNQAVLVEGARSGGQPPNDLLDQRDALIRDLSKFMDVSTVTQDDGAVNVFIGKGQLLVRGSKPSQLTTYSVNGKPDQLGVALQGATGPEIPVNEKLIGGSLGGVLGYRDRMLDPASNNLGRLAIGMGTLINQQNSRGMNLDGALGTDVFTVGQPEVLVKQGAASNVNVAFSDVGQLTNLDYKLSYTGGSWNLVRTDNQQSVSMTGSGTNADPFLVDGMSITVNAAPANGDSYEIHPTRNGAIDMQMVLANSRQLATAAPVRSLAASTNTGSATISAGVVNDINNAAFQTTAGQLTPPLLIRFTGANSYDILDNTNPAAPVSLESGIAYNAATGADIFPTPGGLDYGYQMRLNGAAASGDTFSTEYNTGGSGDNRNALLMNDMSSAKLLQGGHSSFSETYNSMVTEIATGTRQSELGSLSNNRLLQQTLATRESISGVNLDEEAANLVQFQQAYQASAQVIAAASSLFNTLLSAVRR